MPKFVIERQYLVPMYQHIAIVAENVEEACKKGLSDDIDLGLRSDGIRPSLPDVFGDGLY